MNNLILIFLVTLIFSCNSNRNNRTEVNNEQKSEEPAKQTHRPVEQAAKLDLKSFNYFLQLTDNIIKEIPRHHVEKFIGTAWDDENDPDRIFYSEKTDHYELYDNYVLTFKVSMYGVAGQTILATFTSEGKMIDHIEVAKSSDMDLSSTSYSSQSFKIFDDSLVQVLDQTTKAKNYNYRMPDSLDLFDLDSTEVVETVLYTYYVIQKSAEIAQVNPLEPILDEGELRTFSKAELRIKRNEFFARLGYIFKSEDLKEYFENTDWYKPLYEDVTHKLTAYDIYNINLIKEIEISKNAL